MSSETSVRFPIRFDPWYRALSLMLFVPPAASFVAVDADEVTVHMAWAFTARFSRSAVASTAVAGDVALSRGVHGWAGRWLVNGSGDGIVAIAFAPAQRARVLGVPVRLRQLLVSVDDPQALVRALAAGAHATDTSRGS